MSLRAYCQNCGQPTEYSLSIPLFCAFCAKPFSATHASFQTANTIQKASKPHPSTDIETDDEDFDSRSPAHVPQLDKLEVELDIPQTHGIKINSIARAAKIEVKDTKVKVPTKKQILADFQKTASSLKKGESAEIS